MILKYKGITINYSDKGTGKTIVLLHGFLENMSMWQPFITTLTKYHRVICIDLLGHGKTGCLGYVHTMEDMANEVHAVLHHLNIKQTILVGHSMGGYVALAYAEKYPETISGLCLMNSTAQADSEERKQNRDRAIQAVKQNHKSFVSLSVVNLFRPKNRTVFAEQIKDIKKEALATPLQGIIAALEGMKVRKDRVLFFKTFHTNKLMMISKKDPVLNYHDLKEQTKNTNINTVEFPDGHMSHVENKGLFLQNLMHFIENI